MTSADIRFTRNKANDTLYVLPLDWPEDNLITVKTLAKGKMNLSSLSAVSLLGEAQGLTWHQDDEGLKIKLGEKPKNNLAHAIKLSFSKKIPKLI